MNFVIDEGIDSAVIAQLRHNKHSVWAVAEMVPGLTDERILQIAQEREAILVTADKDFGELVFRQGHASHGVLLLRLHGLAAATKATLVGQVVDAHADKIPKSFVVVTQDLVQIRLQPQ
ncbi:MAG: DUF5615 family PIN-like protein [Nitrospira sp.]|uniref:DUF5615 domain-containing protein n=1 Tax=Nitrospira defluvii TaxID=330214 RepID=A0ABM8REK2_9BACT|nr:DUF5615 family PIN-like protein [Nitrospira defluvii]MCS6327219.1 DUF5615 family PIN-like protein [Nitrospira sp.]CAE6748877.1 conserved hypothetical protein [Nitrospira defluvii]